MLVTAGGGVWFDMVRPFAIDELHPTVQVAACGDGFLCAAGESTQGMAVFAGLKSTGSSKEYLTNEWSFSAVGSPQTGTAFVVATDGGHSGLVEFDPFSGFVTPHDGLGASTGDLPFDAACFANPVAMTGVRGSTGIDVLHLPLTGGSLGYAAGVWPGISVFNAVNVPNGCVIAATDGGSVAAFQISYTGGPMLDHVREFPAPYSGRYFADGTSNNLFVVTPRDAGTVLYRMPWGGGAPSLTPLLASNLPAGLAVASDADVYFAFNCTSLTCNEGNQLLDRGPWLVHARQNGTTTVQEIGASLSSYRTTQLVLVPFDGGGPLLGVAQQCAYDTSECDAGTTRIGLIPPF